MSSKLIDQFIESQIKLVNPPTKTLKSNPKLINIEPTISQDTMEITYNMIIEKKPSNKKVIAFLQDCINKIIEDED